VYLYVFVYACVRVWVISCPVCSHRAAQFLGVDVMIHLTCSNLTTEQLRATLEKVRAAGLQNILALRGDPPKGLFALRPATSSLCCAGAPQWEPVSGGVRNAAELVRLIRQEHGDYFCIFVAGHPEGHPDRFADILNVVRYMTNISALQ
jgi:methylenetetrahydrofolate reductase (NADPH)